MRFLITKNGFQVTCRKKAKPVSALNDFFWRWPKNIALWEHFHSEPSKLFGWSLSKIGQKPIALWLRAFFFNWLYLFFFWDRFNLCSHLWLGLWFNFSNCFAAAGWFLLRQRFFPFLWCFFRFLRFVFVLCNRLSKLPVYFFAPF